MSSLQEIPLRKLLDVVVDNRGKTPPISEAGYELLEVNAISQDRRTPDYSKVRKFVSEETYKNWFRKGHPQPGDILVPTVGTIGNVALVQESRGAIAQNLIALRFNSGVDSRYIYYFLSSSFGKDLMLSLDIGGVQPSIKVPHLLDLDIPIPDYKLQKAIASVLSSLDDKIDLLHRQNTTLERMAETLFRQWFVEEVRGDWEEVTIADLIEFNPPRKLSKNQISTYIDMAGLDTSNFNPNGWYLREFSSGTKFINNDTLLARITPCLENGKTGYVSFLSLNEVGWGSTEFIVMRPKLGIHPFFAYVLARYQDFRDYAEGCMEGSSGRQRVNTDHLKQYQIRMPSKEVIQRFNEAVGEITPKLELNAKQIKTLEKLRDNLLPKLMSGEVTIKNEVK